MPTFRGRRNGLRRRKAAAAAAEEEAFAFKFRL